MMDDTQYLTPPTGFEPPQGTQEGGEFDASIRAKLDPDGRLCVLSINGTPLDNPKEEGSESEEEDMKEKSDMPKKMMTLMGAATKDGYA